MQGLGNAPLTVQCTNGGVVHLTININIRNIPKNNLKLLTDLLESTPGITKNIFVEKEHSTGKKEVAE